MLIKHLDDLLTLSVQKGKASLVVACAEDKDVLKAILSASQSKIINPILVGDEVIISRIIEEQGKRPTLFKIVHQPDKELAIHEAIQHVRTGKARILMKGMVSTSKLLKAVLDKSYELIKTPLLSHFALFESPYYHKLFGITDAAMNIEPSVEDKVAIIENAISFVKKLGIDLPKVALITPIEKVNRKILSTLDADDIKKKHLNGQIPGCLLDGPLALDNAISKEAARQKGIVSEVAGDADILVPHDLDAANILYKSINFLGGGKCAAIVLGATIPIVLTSRADDEVTKLLSIALSTFMD